MTKYNGFACCSPHLSSPRQIMHGQHIHESVLKTPSQRTILYGSFIGPLSRSDTLKMLKSERSALKRRARLPDELAWDEVVNDDNWIERDPYQSANRTVDGILNAELSDADCHVLVTLSSTGESFVRFSCGSHSSTLCRGRPAIDGRLC